MTAEREARHWVEAFERQYNRAETAEQDRDALLAQIAARDILIRDLAALIDFAALVNPDMTAWAEDAIRDTAATAEAHDARVRAEERERVRAIVIGWANRAQTEPELSVRLSVLDEIAIVTAPEGRTG